MSYALQMSKSSDSKLVHVYYDVRGAHIHMRLFMNGAMMGSLVCRLNEWDQLRASLRMCVFIDQNS